MNFTTHKAKQITGNAFSLYKNHFNVLIHISAIAALPNFIFSTINGLMTTTDPEAAGMQFFVLLFIGIPSVYFGIRLNITLFLSIIDLFNKKEPVFKNLFGQSKIYFRNFFLISILLGLIMILPVLLMMYGVLNFQSSPFHGIFVLIGLGSIIFLLARYGLGPYITIFEKDQPSPIKYAGYLTINHMKTALLVFSLIIIIQLIPVLFNFYLQDVITNGISFIIRSFINVIISILISPFIYSLVVRLYYEIREKSTESS